MSQTPDPSKFLESCLWALIDANEDGKLTELCRKIIPRVLVALRSDAARGKALEVVKTLSTRVKSSTAVLLPVVEIYDVFRSADASPYEKNISLMFLEMGWKRAEPAVQAKLVLSILPDVASQPEQYHTTLLQMALSALEHVGSLTSTAWTSIKVEGESAKVIRGFLLDVLLYAAPGAGQARAAATATPGTGGAASAGAASSTETSSPPPPGMSIVAVERIQTKSQQSDGKSVAEYLVLRKVAVLKALTAKMLSDVDAFPLAAVASCGAHHDVRRLGEDLLRTLMQANRVDLDADCSVDAVNTLFALLLGNAEQIKKELQAAGKPPAYMGAKPPTAFVASAVDVPTRVALLAQLCRSVRAANTFPQALQAIFQGLYGADASVRLKQAAMQFAVWTTSNARSDMLKPIAPIVLTGLIKFVKEGEQAVNNPGLVQLRGFTYSALGQLARRAQHLFLADVSIAELLFESLASEPPEVKVSVQEALSMSCTAYRGVCGEDKQRLMKLLLGAMEKTDSHQARFCAVYWANRLFAFSDVRARYVCLLAVADGKIEVREEAERGLYLPGERSTAQAHSGAQAASLLHAQDAAIKAALAAETYPSFEEMVRYLSTDDMVSARRAQTAGVKAATVAFCNRCLTKSCQREGGITKAQYLQQGGRGAGGAVPPREVAAEEMNALIEDALTSALGGAKGLADAELARKCLVALTDLQIARSDVVQRRYGGRLPWLENFLFSTNSDTRELAACIYGELAASMEASAAEMVVQSLAKWVIKDEHGKDASASLERRQGSILALGYVLSHAVDPATNCHKISRETVASVLLALTLSLSDRRTEIVSAAARAIGLTGVHSSLPLPDGKMPPAAASVPSAASPESRKGGEGERESMAMDTEEVELTIVRVIRALGAVVNKKGEDKDKSSDTVWKEAEDAAHSVGMIAVSNRSPDVLHACTSVLFSTAGLKRTEEFHFCVGEALACCAGGRVLTSPQLLSQLRLPPAYQDAGSDAERSAAAWAKAGTPDSSTAVMVKILEYVMNDVLTDGKPLVRAAGAPWLLCLLRYNSESSEVQSRIALFQEHFAYLLQERGEYLQEVASKGLGLCYDMCTDDAVKDELVATLAKALMSGAAMTQPKKRKSGEDEQLFEEGEMKIDDKALGEGSLTTYKELCTVATELGQPELIYRFLNLAGHQKVWNSKRGAAFGFSLIANKAADRLKPHLSSLIPKLYRYQYDPNQSIQEAMGNLWQTVVPDPDKAKDEYLPHILKELIPGIGSRLWRVREASCLALADLLTGRRLQQVEEHLVEVYRMSLRALDDVKETVRKAGQTLHRAVSGLCAKFADPSQSDAATADKVLGLILPLLLQEGIAQSAAEVRVASVQQLVKMTKHAGASLAPHIPELAAVLLESLSSLEPQMNTYLQLNADKYDVSGEALERMRVSASRNSPLSETLDLCVRFMDEAAAEATIPRAISVVRQGVGLPTRCGCARFIGQLAVMPGPVGQVVRRQSGKLLKALGSAIVADRSAVVRQAMGGAAARVVAVAKEGATDEYIQQLSSTYFEKGPEDGSVRVMVGVACKDLLSMAADAIKDYYAQLLPLAFVAREDDDKDAAEAFKTVWEEGAGSTSAGLRVYSKEISDTVRAHLASASWAVRKMAAKAAFASVDAAEGAGAVDSARANRAVCLLPALKASISNPRMWDGKECVLKALAASIVAANESALDLAGWRRGPAASADCAMSEAAPDGSSTVVGEGVGTTEMLQRDAALSRGALVGLLVAECRKKRKEYRKAALEALKMTLEKLDDVNVAAEVMNMVQEVVSAGDKAPSPPPNKPSAGRDADEEERYDAMMESKGLSDLRARALEALAAAWPSNLLARQQLVPALLQLIDPYFKSPSIEERLAAIAVASAAAARMSAQITVPACEGADAEGASVVAEVTREWQGLAAVFLQGLYLGMNDLGPARRAVRKAALTACQEWFALSKKLGAGLGTLPADLRARLDAALTALLADQTDTHIRDTAQALLKVLSLLPPP